MHACACAWPCRIDARPAAAHASLIAGVGLWARRPPQWLLAGGLGRRAGQGRATRDARCPLRGRGARACMHAAHASWQLLW